jgi:hypothetical protein
VGGLPSWAQTVVNASAVALLAFLFLLNLTQVCVALGPVPRRRRVMAVAAVSWPPIRPSASSAFYYLSIFSE